MDGCNSRLTIGSGREKIFQIWIRPPAVGCGKLSMLFCHLQYISINSWYMLNLGFSSGTCLPVLCVWKKTRPGPSSTFLTWWRGSWSSWRTTIRSPSTSASQNQHIRRAHPRPGARQQDRAQARRGDGPQRRRPDISTARRELGWAALAPSLRRVPGGGQQFLSAKI